MNNNTPSPPPLQCIRESLVEMADQGDPKVFKYLNSFAEIDGILRMVGEKKASELNQVEAAFEKSRGWLQRSITLEIGDMQWFKSGGKVKRPGSIWFEMANHHNKEYDRDPATSKGDYVDSRIHKVCFKEVKEQISAVRTGRVMWNEHPATLELSLVWGNCRGCMFRVGSRHQESLTPEQWERVKRRCRKRLIRAGYTIAVSEPSPAWKRCCLNPRSKKHC